MKNFVFLFLILIVLSFFIFSPVGITNLLTSQKSFGFLKIESIPKSVAVFIDEKEVGVTPWESKDVEEGVHKIKLIGDGLGWEGKVEVTAGLQSLVKRILGPGDSFLGGITVFYQKTKNGDGNLSLAITAKPEKVKVIIDDKEHETPIVLEGISKGEHKLKFSLVGYLTEEVEIEAKKGFLTNVDVEMTVSPFGGKERIITEGEGMISTEEERISTENGNAGELQVIPRVEWGGKVVDISDGKLTLTPWQKIEVYPIIFDTNLNWRNNTSELVSGMDFYAREFLGLPGIPFAYLITEDGKVYEGLGVRNFDYSSFESKLKIENWQLKIDSGVCPIAYLSATSELSNEAQKALSRLQSYLAGSPKNKAKLITVLQPITIAPSETREITLEFQNIGEVTWPTFAEASVGGRVFLVTVPLGRASNFYTRDSWIAVDKVTLPQEERVAPGQTAKFTFLLTAPFCPDEITENLGLLIEGEDKIVEGSEVSLEVSVWAEGLVTVEIKDTPTGFLNVRNGPSTYAELIGTVYPGEKYLFLEEQSGFYKIKLRDGSDGWVYAKYAEKK